MPRRPNTDPNPGPEPARPPAASVAPGSLRRALAQHPAVRGEVVASLTALVERELAQARGVRAAAARRLYGFVRQGHPDLTPRAVDALLEPWLDALQPLWDRAAHDPPTACPPPSFAALVSAHPAEAADALLRLAEVRAASSRHAWARAAARRARRLGTNTMARVVPDAARLVDSLTRAHLSTRGLHA